MMTKAYTKDEVNQMVQMYKQGATLTEIAEMFGRTVCGVKQRIKREKKGTNVAPAIEAPKPVTLKDFSPREMIKHLYDMGYRIENNQIVCYVKQVVKVNDIING